jgi:mannitol/fructose-specific phosphotransferase system IIA component
MHRQHVVYGGTASWQKVVGYKRIIAEMAIGVANEASEDVELLDQVKISLKNDFLFEEFLG